MFSGRSVPEHRQTASKRIAAYLSCASFLFLAALLLGFHGGLQAPKNVPAARGISAVATENQPRLAASYGKLPLSFEFNQGQTDPQVKFLSRGRGYSLFLTGDAAVLTLRKLSVVSGQSSVGTRQNPSVAPTFRSARGGVAATFRSAGGGVAQHPPFGAAALPDPLPLSGPEKTSDNEVEKPRDRRAGPALPFSSRRLADTGESSAVVRMKLVGANVKAAITGAEELPGKSDYFIGNDPKKWRTNVPTYAEVRYENVYPGIDLVYYGNQGGQLEYDFVVAPGADPNQIKLSFGGAQGMRVDAASGDLVLKVGEDEVRFHKPVVYQPAVAAVYDRRRRSQSAATAELDGTFVVASDNEVAFRVAGYDPNRALVIDPMLSYSTYLGGRTTDYGNGLAVDSSGNAYVTGFTNSTNFPTANPLQGTCDNCSYNQYAPAESGGDAFVAKLNSSGSALVYSTYLGGSANDVAYGIAVDSAGNAYVTGNTLSTDFPTANPLQGACISTNAGGDCNSAFVAKLNPTGSALVYSTFLGAYGTGYGIAVDSAGSAYMTGFTGGDFPTVNPIQGACTLNPAGGCGNAFVTKLNPAGSALVYATYLGGNVVDWGNGIAVDAAGSAYVTGKTCSTNFPTANPLQPSNANGGCSNAFVAKLNPAGSALVYSTYLGGSGTDYGAGIAVDSSGNAYVTGSTASADFPTANAFQPKSGGGGNAFVAKLNPAGSALVYSTYLGGSGQDYGSGIAVDGAGNAYVTGTANSPNFPTVDALQPCPAYGFVAKFNPTGSALVYSTCLGGLGDGIAVDASGNAYVTGVTNAINFLTVNPLQPTFGGVLDAFVAKIIAAVTLSPTSLSFSNQMVGTTSPAQAVTLGNFGNANLTFSSIAITGSVTGDFAIATDGTTCSTSSALAAGTSCTINVTFTPTIVGSESAILSVGDNVSGSPQTVALSGTGTLLRAPNVSPTSLSFNNQLVGATSASQPVTVTNTGAVTMSISSLTISSGWTQSNNCLPSVAANASCTINVSFRPTAVGFQSGTLTLTDNAVGSPQTVSLSGTGVVPAVSLSATSLSFHPQTVSTPSPPQTLTLTNTGAGALTPLTITTTGDFAQTNTCAGSVAAGASCTVSVTFTPTATGNRAGTLTLTDNASNSPQQVSLSGTGLPPPVVSLSTTSLSFPAQTVSTSSPAQKLLLTNTGAGTLTPLTITISGDFTQTNTCAGSVAAGAGCEISVTFTPTALGNRTGTLTLTDNAGNSPQTVSLTGNGSSPPSGWQLEPGLLSQVSVGSDGTVWGINSAGQVYMFNPQTQTWQQAPGLFTQIAVGSSGFVWALNAAGQVYRYDPAIQNWDYISGTLSQIAVGSDGDVWGINASSQIYHFNSATQNLVQIPGALAQIAVGYDGAIWGINAAQQIYRFNPGTQSWQQIPGALKRVAVGADGDVWGINNAGQIYHFNSLSQQWDNAPGILAQIAVGSASNVWGINSAGAIWRFNAQAQAWNQIPGQLAQIAVGANGAVWGLNSANQIYQFVQPTQPTQTFHQAPGLYAQIAAGIDGEVWGIDAAQRIWRYDAQLQSWQQIPGALSEIRVGFGGNIWGLNAAGQILQFNPSTETWNQIPGSLAQLEVGADGSVWGIDSADRIWRFNPSTQAFEQIPGSLAQLAVGADGTVWGINNAGQIYGFNPATQGWVQIPGSLAQIAVGSANNVWGLNAAGQIWRYDPLLQKWDSIPGALTSLAVAFDGTVWGLNSANQIWRFNTQTQSWNSVPGLLSQVSVGADAVVWGLNAGGQAYQYW